MSTSPLYELEDILPMLPHRPPFLFVDRVLKLVPHQRLVAERTLRPEEPYFAGHFPGNPIMPGVLVAEALAQTSGLLLGLSERQEDAAPTAAPKMFFLAATQVKFTHPASPGMVLTLQAESAGHFGGLFRFKVEASSGPHLIAGGNLTLALVEASS